MLCFAGSPGGGGERPELDFWVGRSDPAGFPLRIWRRIVNRLLSHETAYLTDYCDPAGLPELRAAIATHLRRARAVAVTKDQVVVTTGGQDALNLVFNLLKGHTRQLCIENPCYLGASLIFRSAGMAVHPVPVDGDGLRTELLPRDRGSLLYVTPSHQFPTGAIMPLTRRLELLRWAEETDSYIVEDDYDSDFRYDGPPLTALAGLDGGRRVFYVGTFSKSVGAGLRIGYATVPRMFWDEARMMKARMSNGQAWLEQAALATFIDEGHFDRHLRRLRQLYKARRDHLVATLRRTFDEAMIIGGESGLHLVWRLPPGCPPARQVQVAARERGIGVYALSSGAAFDVDQGARDDMLVFGYSSLTEAQIGDAVGRLKSMLRFTRRHAIRNDPRPSAKIAHHEWGGRTEGVRQRRCRACLTGGSPGRGGWSGRPAYRMTLGERPIPSPACCAAVLRPPSAGYGTKPRPSRASEEARTRGRSPARGRGCSRW